MDRTNLRRILTVVAFLLLFFLVKFSFSPSEIAFDSDEEEEITKSKRKKSGSGKRGPASFSFNGGGYPEHPFMDRERGGNRRSGNDGPLETHVTEEDNVAPATPEVKPLKNYPTTEEIPRDNNYFPFFSYPDEKDPEKKEKTPPLNSIFGGGSVFSSIPYRNTLPPAPPLLPSETPTSEPSSSRTVDTLEEFAFFELIVSHAETGTNSVREFEAGLTAYGHFEDSTTVYDGSSGSASESVSGQQLENGIFQIIH